ncbi:MAG: ABC transporter permease [Comamonadaceae bacterium]|nr:MAG: ABC transporter permease [Comamonadaceae bacterium]
MLLLRLLLRNAFRHRLRTALTVIGLVAAICAFGLLRTLIGAWYASADASSSTRLVSRNAVSLTFALPLSYAPRMRAVEGVTEVSAAVWFGGIYQSQRNFFPQFAVQPESYLRLYPEYRLPPEQQAAFLKDRQGVIVGRKLAERFGWKVGDSIALRGTIFPGTWTFTLRGIWTGAQAGTDESQLLMHYALLNESLRVRAPSRADNAGVFFVGIDRPDDAAAVAQQIDALFANSLAETKTEAEQAFQLSFVAMSSALLAAIQAVSVIVILIVMAVMANTMAMTARERLPEYATLRALGFRPGFIATLLMGESLLVALLGAALGIALTWPAVDLIASALGNYLPHFRVAPSTMLLQALAALGVGAVAAAWPAWQMSRADIVQGLRHVG